MIDTQHMARQRVCIKTLQNMHKMFIIVGVTKINLLHHFRIVTKGVCDAYIYDII